MAAEVVLSQNVSSSSNRNIIQCSHNAFLTQAVTEKLDIPPLVIQRGVEKIDSSVFSVTEVHGLFEKETVASVLRNLGNRAYAHHEKYKVVFYVPVMEVL